MIQIRIGNAIINVSRASSLKCNDDGLEIFFKEELAQKTPLRDIHEHKRAKPQSKFVIPNDFYDEDPQYLDNHELDVKEEVKNNENLKISEDIELSQKESEYLREGAEVLRSLATDWSVNYREEKEQPDRQRILMNTVEFDYGKMHKYIEHCGGLTHAIIECTELERPLARDIAMNICQVSSILFPPLSQLCELSFKI